MSRRKNPTRIKGRSDSVLEWAISLSRVLVLLCCCVAVLLCCCGCCVAVVAVLLWLLCCCGCLVGGESKCLLVSNSNSALCQAASCWFWDFKPATTNRRPSGTHRGTRKFGPEIYCVQPPQWATITKRNVGFHLKRSSLGRCAFDLVAF